MILASVNFAWLAVLLFGTSLWWCAVGGAAGYDNVIIAGLLTGLASVVAGWVAHRELPEGE